LKIAGYHELSRPNRGLQQVEPARRLCRVFSRLSYELGVLSPDEASFLEANRIDPPKGWLLASEHPKAKIFSLASRKIAVLVFPYSRSGETGQKEVLELARKLRPETDLLIGLSPWGIHQERSFLGSSPHILDIFLGGGPGPGFKSKFMQGGATLWVRPYGRGKVVFSIRIKEWPSSPQSVWRPGQTVDTDIILLKKNIPEDEAVRSLLE
jgi:hypothetical protein